MRVSNLEVHALAHGLSLPKSSHVFSARSQAQSQAYIWSEVLGNDRAHGRATATAHRDHDRPFAKRRPSTITLRNPFSRDQKASILLVERYFCSEHKISIHFRHVFQDLTCFERGGGLNNVYAPTLSFNCSPFAAP
jgi:hypothetical protein